MRRPSGDHAGELWSYPSFVMRVIVPSTVTVHRSAHPYVYSSRWNSLATNASAPLSGRQAAPVTFTVRRVSCLASPPSRDTMNNSSAGVELGSRGSGRYPR